jgi:hypothetical protein
MTLSSEEISILTAFLDGHGIIEYVFPLLESNRAENIIEWLNTVPNANDYNDEDPLTGLKQVLHGLTFAEKVAIFGYESATHWYREIVSEINNGVITDKLVEKYIDIFSQKTSNMGLLTFSFNHFLSRVVQAKDMAFLNQIFYIMLKQGLISQSSLDKISIEFSSYPRFITIGLGTLPSESELNNILETIEA